MTYFKLFFDSLELLEPLDDAERGRLLTALLQYANSGEIPALSGNERFLFPVFKRQLERDQAEYSEYAQRQRANGNKGGRPRANRENPVVFSETRKTQDDDQEQNKEQNQEQHQDEEEDTAVAVAAAAWGEGAGISLSAKARRELARFVRQMGPDCCQRAFEAAQDAGKHSWSYVRGVLQTKQEQGVRSAEDWDRLERQREQWKKGGKNGAACQPNTERIQKNTGWLEKFLMEQEKQDWPACARTAPPPRPDGETAWNSAAS